MRIAYHVMSAPSPLGLLFLATTERGLRYVEFMDRRSLKRTIAAHAAENPGAVWEPSVRELRPLAEELEQFFCGAIRRFHVPLDPLGSEFQLKVWRALLDIPYGTTRSYGEIAKAIGDPKAARAVGLANNQNPVCIVVPCHRVIGADGKLVGYAGGLPRKKYLLGLEKRFGGMQSFDGDRVIESLAVKVSRPPARVSKPAKPRRAGSPGAVLVRPRSAPRAAPVAAKPAPGRGTRKLAAAPARRRAR